MRFILLLLGLWMWVPVSGQYFYVSQTTEGKEGVDILKTDMKGKVLKTSHISFSQPGILENTFMVKFQVGSDHLIYWQDNFGNIFVYNPATGKSKRLTKELGYIAEFCVRDTCAYIAFNNLYNDDVLEAENRFSDNVKLVKIDLHTLQREAIHIAPKETNFTDINVSLSGRYISFVDTRDVDIDAKTVYYLKIYDMQTKQVKTIDTARFGKGESYGEWDNFNMSVWLEGDKLAFFERNFKKDWMVIREYDLEHDTKRTVVTNMPQPKWIGWYQGKFILDMGKEIRYTKDGKKWEPFLKNPADNKVMWGQGLTN